MPAPIEFTGQDLVNFRDHRFSDPLNHGFRWIDIKRFRIPGVPPTDDELLRALLGHRQFADGYNGAGADPDGRAHGPYRVDRITVDVYETVSAAEAIAVINRWALALGNLPESLAAALESDLYTPIRRADSLYRLTELPQDAHHDLGFIHTEFHELVVIDRAAATLSLVVAADD